MPACARRDVFESLSSLIRNQLPATQYPPLEFLYPQWVRCARAQPRRRATTLGGHRSSILTQRLAPANLQLDLSVTASIGRRHYSHKRLALMKEGHGVVGESITTPNGELPAEALLMGSTVRKARAVLTSSGEVESSTTLAQPRSKRSNDFVRSDQTSFSSEIPPLQGDSTRSSLDTQSLLPVLAKAAMVRELSAKSFRHVAMSNSRLKTWTGTQTANTFRMNTCNRLLVKVLPDEGQSDIRTLVLEGSVADQERAVSMITSNMSLDDKSDDDRYAHLLSKSKYIRVENLPKPERWTIRTFLLYVRAITNNKNGKSINRVLYARPGPTYAEAAIATLCKLFSDPEACLHISTAALRLTLRFCRQHLLTSWAVSKICESSIAAGVTPDVDCFNEELGRVLALGSTSSTRQLLETMLQHRIQFNGGTWKLLLKRFTESPARQQMLEIAEQQGFFSDAKSRRELAAAWCDETFRSIRDQPGALAALTSHMKQVFGEDWVSPGAIKSILKVGCVVPRNPTLKKDILSFVFGAQPPGICLGDDCLQALLRLLSHPEDNKVILPILRTQHQCFESLSQSPQFTTRIFGLAWNRRQLNLCRLIWHCAAVAGNITYDMVATVKDSVIFNVRQGGTDMNCMWYLVAGKLILGTTLDCSGFERLFPNLYDPVASSRNTIDGDPRRHLLRFTKDDGTREQQILLAQLLIERDLHAWKHFKPMTYDEFTRLLDLAIRLDEGLQQDKAILGRRPVKLLRKVIEIPLTPRDKPVILHHKDLNIDSNDSRKWFQLGKWKMDKDNLTWSGTRPWINEATSATVTLPPRLDAYEFMHDSAVELEEERRQMEALERLDWQARASNAGIFHEQYHDFNFGEAAGNSTYFAILMRGSQTTT